MATDEFNKCLREYMDNSDLSSSKARSKALWTVLKNSSLPLSSLLPALEPFLTAPKELLQVRALKLLTKALHHRTELSWQLQPPELFSLISFFSGVIKAPLAGPYGIKGISGILDALTGPIPLELYDSLMDLLSQLQVPSYEEKTRRYVLKAYVRIYEKAGEGICGAEDRKGYFESWLRAFKGENSHVNVKLMLEHMLTLLAGMKQEVILKNAAEIFKVIFMYFPVRIAKSGKQFADLQKTIATLLIRCMTANQAFVPLLFPFLLEKLASMSVDTVLDALFALLAAVKAFKLDTEITPLNDALHTLLKDNVNPDVLNLAIELQAELWNSSLAVRGNLKAFKASLAAFFAEIKGTSETPGSLIIKRGIERSPELCAAILIYGVVEHMEIFMVCADGIQKSVLLRCITRTFYECSLKVLQSPEFAPETLRTMKANLRIIEGFCKAVLFGGTQFDRYDVLLSAYISFFVHVEAVQKAVPEHDKTLQVLIDVLKSRLAEEKRFQEVISVFVGILPPESVNKSSYLASYLDSAFGTLETFHKELISNSSAQSDSKIIFTLRLLSSMGRFPAFFKKFVDISLGFLGKAVSQPKLSVQIAEWTGQLMEALIEAITVRAMEGAKTDVREALKRLVLEFPGEIRCPAAEWKKLEENYIKAITTLMHRGAAHDGTGDFLYSGNFNLFVATDRTAVLTLKLRLNIAISLAEYLSKSFRRDEQKALHELVLKEICAPALPSWGYKLGELAFRIIALSPQDPQEMMGRYYGGSLFSGSVTPQTCFLKLLFAFGCISARKGPSAGEEWIRQVLEYGASSNSEENVERSIKFWKKAMRTFSQYADAKAIVGRIKTLISESKAKHPEAHLLTLLQFLLEPETGPDSIQSYSRDALVAIQALPPEIKRKDYILPILAFIISAEGAADDLIPILLHTAKAGKIKTRLKGLGLLLALLRKQALISGTIRELVAGECRALLADPKRAVRTFVRACLNQLLSGSSQFS